MASPDTPEKITYFAETDYRSQRVKFGIRDDDRAKHMYIIGKTGMGKSTLLENLAVQDIQNGEGVCFIDPHGGTAETLLSYVPEHRIKDVIYFAPFDQEFPVALNVMEDMGRDKRPLIVSGLIGAFKKVWVDAWSPRMEYLLSNALLALLETPGSTLLGVNRMFADKAFRSTILANVEDPSVRSFWFDEFAKYSDKFATEATAAIQNKIGQFAANPLIRNMVGQPKSTFDIRQVMDERKILIVNLSKGRMGEGNANLVGSMLITKIYLAAMSRADVGADVVKGLPPFYLYVDEFQSFANESFADILSEARKYKLSLTIAHQYIEQMSDEVRAAVFGNVGSMVSFRVGAYDADVLEKEFAPAFTAEDMVNLGFAQIYLKLMIHGVGSAPFSATTLPPVKKPMVDHAKAVIASSRQLFARPRAVVEAEIVKWHEPIQDPSRDPSAPPPPETRKYAPGTRPQRDQEGTRRSPLPTALPRVDRTPDTDALRTALAAAMVEKSPSNPLPKKREEQRPHAPRPTEFRSSGVMIDPPSSRPPTTPPSLKSGLAIPRAPYAPMAISPGVHTAPAIPSPLPSPATPTPVTTPVSRPEPRLPAPPANETHRPFAAEFAKLTAPQKEAPQNTPSLPDAEKNIAPAPSVPTEHKDRRVETPSRNDRFSPRDRRGADRPTQGDRPFPQGESPRQNPAPHRESLTPPLPAASLSLLKSNAKKDKGPSEEHLASLRDVLRAATAPAPTSASSPAPLPPSHEHKPEFLPSVEETEAAARLVPPTPPSTPSVPPVFAPKQPIRPMEIPEDVLKNLLSD